MASKATKEFRYLLDKLFLFSLTIYILNKWLVPNSLKGGIAFFNNYLNDLIFPAVAIPLILFITKLSKLRYPDTPPKLSEIIPPIIVWSIGFEYVGPVYLNRGTADIFDVVAYFAGGLGSWMWWNYAGLKEKLTQKWKGL
ncbi:hypothetical protein [Billgrantia kenyensis]|uniref:VanZ-like domain-containing protein n=1 Tax=Billgrantia kenyensis TaxID=321266 RepID=A0A7W0AFB0_9GAMM|nr:hypothetical protein [Halomonas kenyensis]MBA2781206.1 hypothetical protein [Halomonas kenyensis]MCG6663888.1 hypothetical protein [Halomonas kenyensis]